MNLFINACVREGSRTKLLADRFISSLKKPFEELRLSEQAFPSVDEEFLLMRDSLVQRGRLGEDVFRFARQFAEAEEIVIAAPFWDLSFPAALKQYFEHVNVVGITFRYTPQGVPEGLCRAKRLTYITTAGGDFAPDEFGFGYVKALAESFYGIKEVRQIKACGLDIVGADVNDILEKAARDAGIDF